MPETSAPSCRRRSARVDPTNPATPVTNARTSRHLENRAHTVRQPARLTAATERGMHGVAGGEERAIAASHDLVFELQPDRRGQRASRPYFQLIVVPRGFSVFTVAFDHRQ